VVHRRMGNVMSPGERRDNHVGKPEPKLSRKPIDLRCIASIVARILKASSVHQVAVQARSRQQGNRIDRRRAWEVTIRVDRNAGNSVVMFNAASVFMFVFPGTGDVVKRSATLIVGKEED